MTISIVGPVKLCMVCGQLRQHLDTMNVTVNPAHGKKNKIFRTRFLYTCVLYTSHAIQHILTSVNSQPRLGRRYFQHIFTQWFWNVMLRLCKQTVHKFSKSSYPSIVLSRLRQKKKRIKRRFLISKCPQQTQHCVPVTTSEHALTFKNRASYI
jgi:hypothetical protein